MTDLNRLLQRLCDAKIDFVIVGGFAAILHGSPLMTRDLDICAVLTEETIEKLREALRDLDPVHRFTPQKLSFLTSPPRGEKLQNLYLETEWGPVDVLTSILGIGDFDAVRTNAVEFDLFDRKCRVISLDDLIKAKETISREKDKNNITVLRAIAEKIRSDPQANT